MSKMGLVLEGGALRGIFTAGVLDYIMEMNIRFPYVIGVSAGAGNAVNYTAGQIGRSKKIITHENKESYFGLNQWKDNGKLLNLDMLVNQYAEYDFPLDFDSFFKSKTDCECVAVDCEKGTSVYFNNYTSNDNLLKCIKASCSVPFVCEPVKINNGFYLDGSIVDSIPIERAIECGCDKVVVILTRQEGGHPTDYSKIKHLIDSHYSKDYPELSKALINRKIAYEKQMEKLQELEKEGKAFIIRPQEQTIGHFENSYKKMCQFYQHGYDVMKNNFDEFVKFMEE